MTEAVAQGRRGEGDMNTDPGYDNRFTEQLQALDRVRAVQRRLLPLRQRDRLDDIVRCFVGMQLDEQVDRIVAVGFDQWLREGVGEHIAALTAPTRTDHGEDTLLRRLFDEDVR